MKDASEGTVEQHGKALNEEKFIIFELYMLQNIFQRLRKKQKLVQINKNKGNSLPSDLYYKRCLRQFFRQNVITN